MSKFEKITTEKKSKKEKCWDEVVEKIDKVRDALDEPIDQGIKDVVIAINALGINTTQSCEGHVDRGTRAPYIDIKAAAAANLNKKLKEARSKDEAESIVEDIGRHREDKFGGTKKILACLDEFYKTGQTPPEQRLTI